MHPARSTSTKSRPVRGSEWLLQAAVVAGAVLIFAFGVARAYVPMIVDGNQFDDSYITYRYAANLSRGEGLVFNRGERVNSASSLSYVLLLAALHRLGIENLERAGALIGVLSGALALAYTALLAMRLSGSPTAAALTVLPLAISGSMTGWAASGMETMFYTALLVMFLYYTAMRRLVPAAILLALGILTRPEAVLVLAAVLFAELALMALRQQEHPAAPLLAAGSAAVVIFLAFNLFYYGSLVPQPVLHKQVTIFYAPRLIDKVGRLVPFLLGNHAVITILAAIFCAVVLWQLASAVIRRRTEPGTSHSRAAAGRAQTGFVTSQHAYMSSLLTGFLTAGMISVAAGPFSIGHRYETPLLPVLAVASAMLIGYLLQLGASQGGAARRMLLLLGGTGILLIGGLQAVSSFQTTAREWMQSAEHQRARKAIGLWIEEHVPRDEPILSHDLGAIAYFAPGHRFIDVEGLVSADPLTAVRNGDWKPFIQELEATKPRWGADTADPDGALAVFRIIRLPTDYFWGLSPASDNLLDLDVPANRVALQFDTSAGRSFRVVEIDPTAYDH